MRLDLHLPTPLSRDKTDRLRPPAAGEQPPEAEGSNGSAPANGPRRRGSTRLGRRVIRTILGERLSARVRTHLVAPATMAREALDRVGRLEAAMASVERRHGRIDAMALDVHAATINLELLKGEIRSVVAALDDLGMAIAPATGLAGAAARLSELRERVNGLDRRLRTVIAPVPVAGAAGGGPAGGADGSPPAQTGPASALFDYVGFERRFRGDPALIEAELSRRYRARLAASPPVLDIGCGNAGLVEVLARDGIAVTGIDTDPSMVAEARDRGLDVRLVDSVSFLRAQPEGSLGAIIATHVFEHLELAYLVELLELSVSRLRPGGILIAETPNPASLIVLGNSFILDPTHVRPLHPSLLTFLCEGAGFRDARLEFYSPATGYHLKLIDAPDAPQWTKQLNESLTKLNQVLFGPQEYALVATSPPRQGEGEDG